jgi:hypothetical protein
MLARGPLGLIEGPLVARKALDAFKDSCNSHDYGYDLLRFARYRVGISSILDDRHIADSTINEFMGNVCDRTGYFGVFRKETCQEARTAIISGLRSWTLIEGNGINNSLRPAQ